MSQWWGENTFLMGDIFHVHTISPSKPAMCLKAATTSVTDGLLFRIHCLRYSKVSSIDKDIRCNVIIVGSVSFMSAICHKKRNYTILILLKSVKFMFIYWLFALKIFLPFSQLLVIWVEVLGQEVVHLLMQLPQDWGLVV